MSWQKAGNRKAAMTKYKKQLRKGKGPIAKVVTKILTSRYGKAETKYITQNATNVTNVSNNGGNLAQLVTPDATQWQQGDQISQRHGDLVSIKKIRWSAILRMPANSTTMGDVIRIIMVRDLQPQGTAYVNADLFTYVGAGVTINSGFNPDTVPTRFRILHDKRYAMNSSGPNVQGLLAIGGTPTVQAAAPALANSYKPITITKRYKSCPVTFYKNTVNTGIAAIQFGAIFLIYITEEGNVDVLNAHKQIEFHDA